jgi:hypothetical protein
MAQPCPSRTRRPRLPRCAELPNLFRTLASPPGLTVRLLALQGSPWSGVPCEGIVQPPFKVGARRLSVRASTGSVASFRDNRTQVTICHLGGQFAKLGPSLKGRHFLPNVDFQPSAFEPIL